MDRSEGGIASRWTTDHSSVFFHLAFFIFMLVSIDFPFLLFPLPLLLFFPFPFLPPVINDNNCKESKEEKMDFVSYFFLTKETKKRREERRNVELTPYFIFVPFLYTFFSAFLSFSILSSYSSSSFFPDSFSFWEHHLHCIIFLMMSFWIDFFQSLEHGIDICSQQTHLLLWSSGGHQH